MLIFCRFIGPCTCRQNTFRRYDVRRQNVILALFWGIYAADVSGQYVGSIFKGQEMQISFLYFLTLKDGTDRLFLNVGTELPTYAT
jgi:hypothetical protein